MSYNVKINRNLNIFDPKLQKQFNITNIKKRYHTPLNSLEIGYFGDDNIEKEIKKAMTNNDTNPNWLYEFDLGNIHYYENIDKKTFSNGNTEIINITFDIEINNIYKRIFIYQSGECPKCKESYFEELNEGRQYKCLECNYLGIDTDFLFFD